MHLGRRAELHYREFRVSSGFPLQVLDRWTGINRTLTIFANIIAEADDMVIRAQGPGRICMIACFLEDYRC